MVRIATDFGKWVGEDQILSSALPWRWPLGRILGLVMSLIKSDTPPAHAVRCLFSIDEAVKLDENRRTMHL